MFFSMTAIIALIEQYGYVIILPISIIEGPIITVLTGFLVSLGFFNAFIAFLVLLLGDILGDVVYYALGKWSNKGFVRRWGKYFFLKEDNVERLTDYFKTRGRGAIVFSKVHAAGSAVLFSAGLGKMHFGAFLWYSFLGSVPKTLVLQAIGMYGGASFDVVNKYINTGAAVTTVIAIFWGAYWFLKHMPKQALPEDKKDSI